MLCFHLANEVFLSILPMQAAAVHILFVFRCPERTFPNVSHLLLYHARKDTEDFVTLMN